MCIDAQTSGCETKVVEDNSVFFVVRDELTHAFRVAFGVQDSDQELVLGPNYLDDGRIGCVQVSNDLSWPVCSSTSVGQVDLTVENTNRSGLGVQRLDCAGNERTCIKHVAGRSQWTGQVPSRSILVFRSRSARMGIERWFYLAVRLPTECVNFRVKV